MQKPCQPTERAAEARQPWLLYTDVPTDVPTIWPMKIWHTTMNSGHTTRDDSQLTEMISTAFMRERAASEMP